MIPFASQRRLGQDLATHLQNEYDNEEMEVADIRGAVAQDLHGAFAEWELQADTLTRCRNYLYSLSVNPDPEQGELTRDQYMDYIARVEQRLGLENQPRAIVFHTKHGREHCHVVWSRIDAENERAVPLAFDRQALMMVTREFARDHGLQLPDGYHKDGRGDQLSLYEQHQQRSTGLSLAERKEQITDAWRGSDTPAAFVQALAEKGYILATGKRSYVVVDLYGEMNALPKLIDDKSVRTKDVRAFLQKEYPPESLPTVDEAKALAAQHRQALKDHRDHAQRAEAVATLERAQAKRREEVQKQQKALAQRQHKERQELAQAQRVEREAQRSQFLRQARSIRQQRQQTKATGLAAFLGRVTGIEAIRKAVHSYQDRQRLRAQLTERDQLRDRQRYDRETQQRGHEMQALELVRQERALAKIDARELKSLEEQMRAEQRIKERGGSDRMPRFNLDLKPRGRPAVPHKAANRFRKAFPDGRSEFNGQTDGAGKQIELSEDFAKAAANDQANKAEHGDGKSLDVKRSRTNRRSRKRDRDKDRGR